MSSFVDEMVIDGLHQKQVMNMVINVWIICGNICLMEFDDKQLKLGHLLLVNRKL